MRFCTEVARAIRANWPDNYPLAFRLSATDWVDGGLEIEDTVAVARALKNEGVDIVDCSTGGIGSKERPRRMKIEQGFQMPFAEQVKREASIGSMAVGNLWDAQQCEDIIATGRADMINIARELLDDPNWPLHAAQALDVNRDTSCGQSSLAGG